MASPAPSRTCRSSPRHFGQPIIGSPQPLPKPNCECEAECRRGDWTPWRRQCSRSCPSPVMKPSEHFNTSKYSSRFDLVRQKNGICRRNMAPNSFWKCVHAEQSSAVATFTYYACMQPQQDPPALSSLHWHKPIPIHNIDMGECEALLSFEYRLHLKFSCRKALTNSISLYAP